ncbi:PREDICTED: proline-rich protein 19 [Thamnophis sirtalis]|uniref:Proline-rich protein 19 n=1 Tax=Thamnophis sirtalis TaxID=35019 RepID=A0A6I9Z1H9_9SAUR|nr:PREDICTED: proline-rich protein 19 [Thamnophis sirtalis]
MNLRDKGEEQASSRFPPSHPLKVPLSEENAEQKSVRVKRRRTRRERDYIKFGQKVMGKIPEQRPNCRGLKKMLPPFWSSQLSNCAKSTPVKGSHVAQPVIITQNRLTQHLGIFNREVKSADIERLLSPKAEHDAMDVTPIQKASGGLLGIEMQSCSSPDTNQKSVPREQGECTLKKDLNPVPGDSHATPVSVREHHPVVQEEDAGYKPSLASPAATFDQQATGEEAFQSNTTVPANDKENVPPPPAEGVELRKRTHLAKELAQDLEKLLDLKAIFPGRDFIGEMRQKVINAVLRQQKTLPDWSTLALLRKKTGSYNTDADDGLSRREDFELFAKPEVHGPRSFFSTAPQPHSLLSTSSESVDSARSSFTLPEEQCAPPAVRTAQSWEQSMGESRGRQERSEGKKRGALKKTATSKRHHQLRQPLADRDSFGSAGLSRSPGGFLVADPQPYPFAYKLSPDRWTLREAEPVPGYNLHPSQELHSSQLVDLGLIERAAPESQTSFDVLKSIWSPKRASKEAKPSQALACTSLAHLPLSSREWNSEQGQPKEFFQLNALSQQPHSFYRHCFQQEVSAPSRDPQLKSGVSAQGKPRLYYQKVSAEQGRTSHNYPFWGLAEASEKTQTSREKGAGNQICSLERLLHLGNLQQLQALQQLPMSYFPPSEALEKGISPLTLQSHLWGQSSPEPWAFPRMRLY